VELGGEIFLEDWVRGAETDTARLYALQAYILNGASITATGGELFYSALLRFRRNLAAQKPYEHEITVRREYLDPATDQPIDPAGGVKAGSMVRVRLTVSSAAWRLVR
jgi:hypothetical protein